MSSDSATLLPTQQSVKAYVDANSFTINNNADNRIITGTATAGTLNAETTLTYGTTGADLAITGGSIGSVPPILRLEDVGSSGKLAELNHITGTTTLTSRNATSNGVIKFAGHNGTSETEYGRITATGELLLNKTSASVGTDGVQLRPSSYSGFSATSATALFVNRNTNDGDVVEIGKNGVKVGSIGTRATYLTMGTGDVGLMFNSGSNRIQPENVTTGAITSGLVDLGYSGGRFKDLHLSGSITSGANGGLIKEIGGDTSVVQGAVGIRINDAASAISPTTASSNNDGSVDLGVSNIRFKDLHLGGTAYLTNSSSISGATASASSFNIASGHTGSGMGLYIGQFGVSANLGIGIDSNRIVTMPAQPAFMATKVSGDQTNITPSATNTVSFPSEVFDNNGDYDTGTATFTAPVTGKYHFNINIRTYQIDTSPNYYHIHLRTSNRIYGLDLKSMKFASDPTYWTFNSSVLVDMDAGDTAYVTFYQHGGKTQVDLQGSVDSQFCGFLVA